MRDTINQVKTLESEVSMKDILAFFKFNFKKIALAGSAGLIIAAAYLILTPNQYEAIAHIAIAQLSTTTSAKNTTNTTNTTASSSLSSLGVNVEEPTLLISRLGVPTTYTPEVIATCALGDKVSGSAILAKSIKLAVTKGVTNVVELKTTGTSPEAASACALAIFELIKATQYQIAAPYIEEANIQIMEDEARLQRANEFIVRSDKSNAVMSAGYISARDEIRYLLDEIASLKNVINFNQSRETRLVAPVYASQDPVAPKLRMALVVGLFGSLFFGALMIMVGCIRVGFKSHAQGIGR